MTRIGILELKDDEFIKDLVSKLSDLKPEFIALQEAGIPSDLDYDVVVDRMSYNHPFLLEVIKNLSLGGTYVINNPFSFTVTNKIVDTRICSSLGIPQPKTMVLPLINEEWDVGDSVREPDLERVGREIGFPCVLKPYNGFAWENVYFVNSMNELRNLYGSMRSKYVLLVQEKIEHTDYYRVFCVSKRDVLLIKYNPKPEARGEYIWSDLKPIESLVERISDWTRRLNSSLDLDFNAVEWSIDIDGNPFLIDAFNELPEVQKNALPPDYYGWIVDRFSQMVRQKAESGERNKNIFSF
jgi:hypothetical protein